MARCATSTSSACCSRLARAPSWCVCPIARQQGVSDVSPIGRVRMLSFSQELQLTTEQYDVACTGTTSPRLSAMLAGLAASVVLFAGAPGASAQQLYASGSGEYEYPAAERYADRAAERFDENLQTQELRDLLSLLQSGNPKLADLEAARLKVWWSSRNLVGSASLPHAWCMHAPPVSMLALARPRMRLVKERPGSCGEVECIHADFGHITHSSSRISCSLRQPHPTATYLRAREGWSLCCSEGTACSPSKPYICATVSPNMAHTALLPGNVQVGFQRGADGRVALKGQGDSHWYSIKTDMQVRHLLSITFPHTLPKCTLPECT